MRKEHLENSALRGQLRTRPLKKEERETERQQAKAKGGQGRIVNRAYRLRMTCGPLAFWLQHLWFFPQLPPLQHAGLLVVFWTCRYTPPWGVGTGNPLCLKHHIPSDVHLASSLTSFKSLLHCPLLSDVCLTTFWILKFPTTCTCPTPLP